ncbi:MAG TPA: 2Fe-2S iron-sulfur cluster-binding protein [Planctomycetaceae bacterium]|nr:2Fe-2S iron-sulfur cluster-binding protein [Planctomycetaceae bacterium]
MRDRPDETRPGPGFSRRDFLRGSGAAVAATAVATAARETVAQDQQQQSRVAPAAPQKITLNVNGKDHQVTVEPRTTLLDVLRNQLNLTGCKEVDERSAAGADTVLVDGKATLAGSRFAIELKGKKIQTVESLRTGEKVDQVVSCFVKHDASQCGFCTPGFVVATRAIFNAKSNASLADVHKGLGGNICRCGTYEGINKCALALAKGGA